LDFWGLFAKSPTHVGLVCIKSWSRISHAWAPLRPSFNLKCIVQKISSCNAAAKFRTIKNGFLEYGQAGTFRFTEICMEKVFILCPAYSIGTGIFFRNPVEEKVLLLPEGLIGDQGLLDQEYKEESHAHVLSVGTGSPSPFPASLHKQALPATQRGADGQTRCGTCSLEGGGEGGGAV
jgi:hypothetical protein